MIQEFKAPIILIPRPSEGEGEGRPGTHCIRMHHHSQILENDVQIGGVSACKKSF